jgi:hypothetical protein
MILVQMIKQYYSVLLILIYARNTMTKTLPFIQNFLVSFFVLSFVFVSVYVPQPLNKMETAEAAFALEITQWINSTLLAIANVYTAATNALQNLLVEKELVLDGILFALAKAIVSQITASIVRWINNGFEGGPAYIQDLKAALLDVTDQEFGRYLEELGGPLSFLCSPFSLDIQIALTISYDQRREGIPGTCSLTGALENIENFIDGDFSDGGWEAWFRIVNQPEIYTPYGSFLAAEAELSLRTTDALQRENSQLNWGKGFMSKKVCEGTVGQTGPEQNCKVVTPGDTIAQSLNFHLTGGTRSLIEADEINEIIGALLGQLAQTVITGAGGLLGVSEEGDDGGSYLDDLEGEGFNLDNLRNSINTSLTTAQRYRSEALLYSGLLAEYASSTAISNPTRSSQALRESQNIVQNLIPALDEIITELTALLSTIDSAPSNPDTNFIRSISERYATLRSRLPSDTQVDASIMRWRGILSQPPGG